MFRDEQFEDAIQKLRERIVKARVKHGPLPFKSMHEVYGKLHEELHECTIEVHKVDKERSFDELLDVAIVAIWGLAGKDNTKLV